MSEPQSKPGSEVMAVAVNFVHTVADGVQLSFGTAFAIDMAREEKNRVLDMLGDLSRRQAALFRKPLLAEELRKHRETLAQFIEDAANAEAAWPAHEASLEATIAELEDDARHAARLEELKDQINADLGTLRKRKQDAYNEGFAQWQASGRNVAQFKPRGALEANLAKMDSAIAHGEATAVKMIEQAEIDRIEGVERAREALTTARAERDQVRKNYEISVKRYEQAIQVREEEMAELDATIEG